MFGNLNRAPTAAELKELRHKWYSLLAREYEEADMRFMNYGFTSDDNHPLSQIRLDPSEQKYRYPIQLYRHVVQEIDLKGKNVLEVGCGRGGGAAFITRHLEPKSYTGIDFTQSAIGLCRKNNVHQNATFLVGDADNLPFRKESFDVVINVESSHCYDPIEKFLDGVLRALVHGGYLLLTDFRSLIGLDELRRAFFSSGLIMLEEKNITRNVFEAIKLENQRKVDAILKLIPENLWPNFHEFAGLEGSQIYRDLEDGDAKYVSYILQKL